MLLFQRACVIDHLLSSVTNSGDSYTTTEFDPLITNSQPGPFPTNPYGNPAYPGGTTCNGPNWLGRLITEHSPPNTLAYNYAAVGATINASIVTEEASQIPSFVNQTATFLQSVGSPLSSVDWAQQQHILVIGFGGNDLTGIALNRTSTDVEQSLVEELVEGYFGLLGDLYNAGARRYLLLSVPRESWCNPFPTAKDLPLSSNKESATHFEYYCLLGLRKGSREAMDETPATMRTFDLVSSMTH